MEIKYSDHVKLVVDLTKQMVDDLRECEGLAEIPGGSGKDCGGRSLNVDIEGSYLCGLPLVIETLQKEFTP